MVAAVRRYRGSSSVADVPSRRVAAPLTTRGPQSPPNLAGRELYMSDDDVETLRGIIGEADGVTEASLRALLLRSGSSVERAVDSFFARGLPDLNDEGQSAPVAGAAVGAATIGAEEEGGDNTDAPPAPPISHTVSEALAGGPRQVPSLGPFGIAEVDFDALGFQHAPGSGRYKVTLSSRGALSSLRGLPLGGGQHHLEGSVSPSARLDTCRSLRSPWSHAAMHAPASAESIAFAYPIDNMADVTLKLASGESASFWQYEDGDEGSEDWRVMPDIEFSSFLDRQRDAERVHLGEYEFVLRGQPRAPFQRNGISGKKRRIREAPAAPLDLTNIAIAFAALGGYVYLDADGGVCGLHALTPSQRGPLFFRARALPFSYPEARQALMRQGRFQEPTIGAFRGLGVTGFCWLAPHETFGSVPGGLWPYGAFVYVYGDADRHLDCVFPLVTHSPEMAGEADADADAGEEGVGGGVGSGGGGVGSGGGAKGSSAGTSSAHGVAVDSFSLNPRDVPQEWKDLFRQLGVSPRQMENPNDAATILATSTPRALLKSRHLGGGRVTALLC